MAKIIELLGKDRTRDIVISAQNVLKGMNRAEDHARYLDAAILQYTNEHTTLENLAFLATMQQHVFTKEEHPVAVPVSTDFLVAGISNIDLASNVASF